ncbi:MAG: alpha/beta fold hydrolase [Candidatus Berkelbacteria bacterium]
MNTKKRILVLHGWNATPEESWFLRVKDIFEPKGFEVIVPSLPGDYFPKYEDWVKVVKDFAPTQNDILIGHSLGGVTILRFLEETEVPVGQIILVATPIEAMSFGQIENFFFRDFNWSKIKSNVLKVNLIYESDDPLVPLAHGQTISEKLNAAIKVVPGGTHLNMMDMKVLEEIIDGK